MYLNVQYYSQYIVKLDTVPTDFIDNIFFFVVILSERLILSNVYFYCIKNT